VAGVLWAAWRLRAGGRSLRELAAPAGAAVVVAVAALALLPVAPERPGLERIDATVTRLAGESVAVEAWRGRPTVVNLWATWCGPCRRELPMLIDELGGRDDVRLALVSQGEDAATVRAYLRAQGLPADDVWTDPSGALGRAVSLVGLPTTVFVDADGAVREVTFGELSRARLAEALSEVVGAP
jgi:thiol-disulfide isomerase/thioredoxin